MGIRFTDNITLFNASSISNTSAGVDVSKRQQIVIELIAAGISSGNGVFTVDGTNDPADDATARWVTGIAVRDAQAATSTTFITSKTLSAVTNTAVYVPAGFKKIRVNVAVTTDGKYTAILESGG